MTVDCFGDEVGFDTLPVVGAREVGALVTTKAVVGARVTDKAMVGARVTGMAVVGALVTGMAVVGARVLGKAKVGVKVTGEAETGALVVGAADDGARVVGRAVAGRVVTFTAVIGAAVRGMEGAGAGGGSEPTDDGELTGADSFAFSAAKSYTSCRLPSKLRSPVSTSNPRSRLVEDWRFVWIR